MSDSSRAGYVGFQQRLARMAFESGHLGAARAALRVLRTSDFSGGAAVSATHLAVLREQRPSERELREAIVALIRLRPADDAHPS